jgi:Ser/Thr protein kinase RdoA (MazF antagonist)
VWDIRNIAFLKKHLSYLEDQADQAIISHFISNYELNINPIEKHLRRQYIHNDGNDHNVLLNNKGHISGIIDFGDMAHTFLACELAVAISYLILEDENPREKIKAVVDGYQIILPLLAEEIDSLIYLICMRACLTVVTANYRKKLFPDNKYISVTEPQSWNFLRNLADMDLRKFKIY